MDWRDPETGILSLHVLGNVVWVGSILSVALLVSAAPFMADPADAGSLARRVYLRLAVPAFVVSFVAGVTRISFSPIAYLHMPWMHAKLACALVVIGVHHALGGKARRVAAGDVPAARRSVLLALVLFLAASGAVFLAIEKSLP